MSQLEQIPDLFRITNKAKARNSDPVTSHLAADKMNEGDNLRKSQLSVLKGIADHPCLDAQSIGVEVAHDRTGLSREQIREVMRIIRPFEKRTPELASMELVDRKQKNGKMLVSINEKGLRYLERNPPCK